MKFLSGVNLCALIEWLKIIKNLVSLPFALFYLVLISVCNDSIFDTGVDGVANGSVDDHLGWVVLLDIG